MNTKEIGRMMLGGFVIYVAMAACAGLGRGGASTNTGLQLPDGSGGGDTGPKAGGDAQGLDDVAATLDSGTAVDAVGIWDAMTDAIAKVDVVDALANPVPDASATEPVSGTRLKAKYRVADDGAKAYDPFTWYDSQRKEDCQFGIAADGKDRCLPVASGFLLGNFGDAKCTKPVAFAQPNCTPKYAYGYAPAVCSTSAGRSVYVVTDPVAVGTPLYAQSKTGCVPAGTAGETTPYFAVGAEISPASFVAGTVQTNP